MLVKALSTFAPLGEPRRKVQSASAHLIEVKCTFPCHPVTLSEVIVKNVHYAANNTKNATLSFFNQSLIKVYLRDIQ